ncbi:transmembrane protein 106A [Pelodytes ibericus]
MWRAVSALKHLVRPGNGEFQPILKEDGNEKSHTYFSVNSTEASGSSYSTEAGSTGTVTCPTCRGTGRIPRGQEKDVVALIPYSDQRLEPPKTKLYVFIAVVTCLLIFFLVVFFLFPRSIIIGYAGVNSSLVTYNRASFSVNLVTTNKLNISNKNLFGISVINLSVEVLHMSIVVGSYSMKGIQKIGPLNSQQIFYTVKSTIDDANIYYICTSDIRVHNILLFVQGSLNCSYLGHWEQITFDGYEYLDCQSNTTVPH